ncbi:ribosome small subunit-dependent GTPase A [Thiohalorhabdus methylotrophus]|uniref:Small ribosomal subunit biogenesis GTPase RsgA n=1 Tax=Thiohalorhabdus methylotrophus TaxID=3242694 RepID=A0ABV4TS26_9GAMM
MDDQNALARMGWHNDFLTQLDLEELETARPVRVADTDGRSVRILEAAGDERRLGLPPSTHPADRPLVGDWLLLDPDGGLRRRLERRTHLARRAAGTAERAQPMAANVDTLFVVMGLDGDFSPSRLERYLVMAREGEVDAVAVLTKPDLAKDPENARRSIEALPGHDGVVTLDPRHDDAAAALAPWLTSGATVAVMGSSGVGKSTLLNRLAGGEVEATGGVRKGDGKGHHTTTHRALYPLPSGAWLLDTPGMRELRLGEATEGLAEVFEDIERLARQCRFRDCAHEQEPGCAVRAAVEAGDLDPRRLRNWHKLLREQQRLAETEAEQRERHRDFHRYARKVMRTKRDQTGRS